MPDLLKEYNKRWFLIVGVKDGTILNFALDRIDDFSPMPNIDYIEPDEELESMFDDIVGVTLYKDKPTENILLWVNEEGYQYVKTKPLHGSQYDVKGDTEKVIRERYPALKGGKFFRLKCILNYELEQLLMSKMDQVVVLEPQALTDSLRNRIKKLNTLYNNI